jgi:hypothetical protein
MKKSAKAPSHSFSKASGERTANLSTKPAVVPTFKQQGLEFGEYMILDIGNYVGLGI